MVAHRGSMGPAHDKHKSDTLDEIFPAAHAPPSTAAAPIDSRGIDPSTVKPGPENSMPFKGLFDGTVELGKMGALEASVGISAKQERWRKHDRHRDQEGGSVGYADGKGTVELAHERSETR